MFKIKILISIVLLVSIFTSCEKLTAVEAYKKGIEYYKEKDAKKAYKYLKMAVDKDDTNTKYHWAAALASKNSNLAYIHTKAAWENGYKNIRVLIALTNLSFHSDKNDKRKFAFSLLKELPDSLNTDITRSFVFEEFEEYDSALVIWNKKLKTEPNANIYNKVSFLYGKKGDENKSMSLLQECRRKKMLNSKGYIMLANLYAFKYNYKGIEELFSEAKKLGFYNDHVQLEHGGYLIIEEKLKDAEKILIALSEPSPQQKGIKSNQQARILLSYIYVMTRKYADIKSLKNKALKTNKNNKSEARYYDALLNLVNDSSNAFEEFKKSIKTLPSYPVINIVYGRKLTHNKKYAEALKTFKKLPKIFLRSPRIIIEYATILAQIGKYDDALATISILHKNKLFTKKSLELFRDIASKKDLTGKSMAAQKLLEKKYKNDVSVQYSSAMLALKSGNHDKAVAILSELSNKYPKEKRFKIARISVFLIQGDYERVIKECKNSNLEPKYITPLLTKAYIKLGKTDIADKIYQKSLKKDKNFKNMLEYAQFLINIESFDKAMKIYEEIMVTNKDKLEKDKKGQALILNNFAWTMLQSKSGKNKTVLSAAKKAHLLLPDNVNILDTYATALIENEKYKDCIKLLTKNADISKEVKLLYLLGTAYEANGNINKAVRTFQDITQNSDSTNVISTTIDRATIAEHIKNLIAQLEE